MLLWKYGDRDTVERADLTGLPPQELAMIGKTLLNLDEIGHVLAPHFEPNAAIRRHAADITGRCSPPQSR